jgi:two-component system sensor histidine kinase SenX3
VRVEVLDDGDGRYVLGDRRQLVSALGNLVENAVKYSEPGQLVEVDVRCSDEFVELVVSDQGVGIPARDLDRIFERFYRVDKARSRGTGGSGLGLSIVRHVATNHHGAVTVTSREGEGSTFVLRLPGPVEPAAADDSGDVPRPYLSSTPTPRGAG